MPKANIAADDHLQLHEDVVTFSGGAQPIREGGRTCSACLQSSAQATNGVILSSSALCASICTSRS